MSKLKKTSLGIGAVIIVAAAVIAILELTDTTHIFHDAPSAKSAATTHNHTDKGTAKEPSKNDSTPPPSNDVDSPKNNGNNTPTKANPSVQPDKPYGQFVSNHRPNLDGQPAPSSESSVCSTSPGVLCKITFTNGSTVKSLPTKRTNGAGSASWNWTLQSVGLTEGKWQATAIATNGDKQAKTTDPIALEVKS